MFFGLENTQKEIADSLELLCREGNLPACMLFSGASFSGKMFAAMCVSRFYSSDTDSTVIVSDRNYNTRIKAFINLYKEIKSKLCAENLKRIVMEYLLQFHISMADYLSSTQKKIFSESSDCRELIESIDYVKSKDIVSFCKKLEKSLSVLNVEKSTLISVNQIRAIKAWCNTSSLEKKQKIVIIEGLENAGPSVSNALLKIIEEPPEDTSFIILSENSGRIPATILSRVRKYFFKNLGKTELMHVLNSFSDTPFDDNFLKEIFSHNGYDFLKIFFINYSGIKYNTISDCVDSLVLKGNTNIPELVAELEEENSYSVFFDVLLDKLREVMFIFLSNSEKAGFEKVVSSQGNDYQKDGIISELEKARRIQDLAFRLQKNINKANALNQNSRLTFDYVFFDVVSTMSAVFRYF